MPHRSRACRLCLLLWLFVLCTPRSEAQGPPPAPVVALPVARQRVVHARMVTGELRALRETKVASQEAGIVEQLEIEVGRPVRQGQVLARLDSERLRLTRDALAAQVASADTTIELEEAAVDHWSREVSSLEQASARGATNARERRDTAWQLAQAKARLTRATHDRAQIAAQLALLEQRIADMTIVAPFAGTITAKETEIGQWVASGSAVCDIVQTDTLEVALDVPQQFLAALVAMDLQGDELVIRLGAGGPQIHCRHVRIVPDIDQRSRTFELLALVDNAQGTLAPGVSVIGYVPTGEMKEHLVIPVDALLRNETGPYVYVASEMGPEETKAMPVSVKVLFELPGQVVIESEGLRRGDLVITEGNARLYPTEPVRVTRRDNASPTEHKAPEADREAH